MTLQRADGSWDFNEELANVLGVPFRQLESRLIGATGEPDQIRRAWATSLAIAFLITRAAANEGEWNLLVTKATRWLDAVPAVPPAGVSWLELAMTELA